MDAQIKAPENPGQNFLVIQILIYTESYLQRQHIHGLR